MLSLRGRKWYQWLFIVAGALALILPWNADRISASALFFWMAFGIILLWSGTVVRRGRKAD
ncbi:MAG: hypothetical protein KA352_16995 [Flavobacteriales bacterium]|nr:hypothetical protein [Flavobacteriales bacterium]